MVTHGNEFQSGFPDLYCVHPTFGTRWVEVKALPNYTFTPAQQKNFPVMTRGNSLGIWILVEATEAELAKLNKAQNWLQYYTEWTLRGHIR